MTRHNKLQELFDNFIDALAEEVSSGPLDPKTSKVVVDLMKEYGIETYTLGTNESGIPLSSVGEDTEEYIPPFALTPAKAFGG